MNKEEKYMNEFLSYVHMGANVYRIYQQKTADLRVKSLISSFVCALEDHEKKIHEVIDELYCSKDDSLKMMQKMTLSMERMKSKMIKEDFKLLLDLLKVTHMAIYQALNFIVKHKELDESFLDLAEEIINEYDIICEKIRGFIEKNYI